ncbi:MAG: translation initiation factor IF-2, partial [Clostridia bacterium]|nr:translation initiation factor IF-2 [Clostridia bacterium]
GYNRPQGDRPQGGGYNRPYGDRPQGGGYNRPQGDRPQGGGYNRPQGDRPQGGFRPGGQRPLEIPKPEFTVAQKEEMNSQRSEVRREFQNKEVEKDIKREQKRDSSKAAVPGKEKRFKPQTVVLSQKKGVSEVLDEEFILDEFYGDDGVKAKKASKQRKNEKVQEGNRHIPHRAVLTSITIPESITVKDLAESLKKTSTDIIKKLMGLGVMATLNQEVDFDTATLIADEFGVKVEKQVVVNEEDILFDDADDKDEDLVPRPPVVVVMGHVDHGKTSLLDAIRETNVIESEAGGITQHIGAYTVKIHDRNITFLDTPGHEAFTAMRARGAQVTDIAILVVAADDGVMPQTIEAINHAKAANVSIIVAINKIDKPGANPDRVKQELTEYGIVAEEWGGDAIMVPVSAKKRMNIDSLLEMVTLAADVLELKTNPNRQAKGTIIEAKLDKARGPVATVLVQRGTLNIGDSIVTGTTVGRIRAMTDDKGHKVKKAGPSTPVEILGLPEVPEAGEIFYAITDEKVARQLADKRKLKQREQQMKASAKVSLEDLFTQIKEGKVKDLNIIVKADVQGSVEAVKQSLEKLSNDEVRVKIIHGGVGAINEADVTLASISNAIIIGFNVRPGANVQEAASNAGVDMRLYRVIYNAIEDVQAAMKGMLEPTFKEVVLGHAEVRQIFKVSGVGTIGGCYVTDGKIARNSEVRIVRNGIVVHEGKLDSLKRFKDDAKEVAQGFECGMQIERYNDIKEGDIIEAFIMEEVAR